MTGWLARILGLRTKRRREEAGSITNHETLLILPWTMARPITIAEHLAAKERLAANASKFIMIDWGEGPQRFYTGFVHPDDYTHRDGYVVHLKGFDRFGWPRGHPESPARLKE